MRPVPWILRVLMYLFVVATVFDSFTFRFFAGTQNVSKLLGLLLAGLCLVLYGTRMRFGGRDVWWVVLFLVVTAVEELFRQGTMGPAMAEFSLRAYLSYVQVLILYFIVRALSLDPRVYRGILFTYFGTFTTAAVLMFFGVMTTTMGSEERESLAGVNANLLSFLLSVIVVCIAVLLLDSWRGRTSRNLMLAGAGMVLVVSAAATGSRGGALALMVGLTVAAVSSFRAGRVSRYILLIPLIIGGATYTLATSPVLRSRFEATVTERDTGGRDELFEWGARTVQERPLIGVGPGYVVPLGALMGKAKFAVHNTYLQLLVSFGLLGTIPLAAAVLAVLRRNWKLRRTVTGSMWFSVLVMILAFGVVAHLGYVKHLWIVLALAANPTRMIWERAASRAAHRGCASFTVARVPVPRAVLAKSRLLMSDGSGSGRRSGGA